MADGQDGQDETNAECGVRSAESGKQIKPQMNTDLTGVLRIGDNLRSERTARTE